VNECASWTPPVTSEITGDDGRLIRYCAYGPQDGVPVMFQGGSPGTRWKRPMMIEAIEQCGMRMVVPDRPGYGGSTRQRGRTVADVVDDVQLLADAQGWARFAVAGSSGGGPHALACAALPPGRVIRCAVGSGICPPETTGPLSPGPANPRRNETSWLAARGEDAVRPVLEEAARDIMAAVEAGGPEFPPDPTRINVPVSIWFGTHDTYGRGHADWLLSHIPTATAHEYAGGHIQNDIAFRPMLTWLRDGSV
jgi:pimeloyl-ACP methyl ester carboxylesterase